MNKKSLNKVSLIGEFDARVWAKEFVRIFTKTRLGRAGIDEQSMIEWFANAIMAGYDHHRWNDEKKECLATLNLPEIKELESLAEEFKLLPVWPGDQRMGDALTVRRIKHEASLILSAFQSLKKKLEECK